MKKFLSIFLAVVLITCMCGCTAPKSNTQSIKIVTTIFPAFDFARQIAGENAQVTMLLPLGNESHFYEPSLSEIAKIEECDLFIYAGGEIDIWAAEILSALGKDIPVICMSELVELINQPTSVSNEHDHEHEHDHSYDHSTGYDSHVWTSVKNAQIICREIKNKLCSIDSANASYYTERHSAYNAELINLDNSFKDAVNNAKHNTLVFAERFPFAYLARDYGLDYCAALSGCSSETEPTLTAIAKIIEKITTDNIAAVFYIEFSSRTVAQKIYDETGAKMLLLHSCHNISKEDFDNGATYVSLMLQNAANIKEALN